MGRVLSIEEELSYARDFFGAAPTGLGLTLSETTLDF